MGAAAEGVCLRRPTKRSTRQSRVRYRDLLRARRLSRNVRLWNRGPNRGNEGGKSKAKNLLERQRSFERIFSVSWMIRWRPSPAIRRKTSRG